MSSRSYWKNFDFVICLITVLIFVIGLTFLYSASYQKHHDQGVFSSNSLVGKQLMRFIVALLVAAIILSIDYKKWLELAYPLYVIMTVFLLLVLFLGDSRLGAQRWLRIAGIGFQPSEFAKLIVIFTLARYLGGKQGSMDNDLFWRKGAKYRKTFFGAFLIAGIPFLLIVKQPDLGTALTLVPVLFAMLYVWGTSIKSLFLVMLPCLFVSPIFWHMLKPYQRRRILVFINPNIDPLGAGYTIIQSKIAIGSGQLVGKGWLSGTQNQLNFLPERHTDFIFSVVGEEWGFIGASVLLILFLIFFWRAFSIGQRTLNASGRLLVSGITVLLIFQVVINIAMTMGLVPVVGLPLPLISYGGTSLFTTIIAIAFILNVGTKRTVF